MLYWYALWLADKFRATFSTNQETKPVMESHFPTLLDNAVYITPVLQATRISEDSLGY